MKTKELMERLKELDPEGEDEVYWLDSDGIGLKVRICARGGWFDAYKQKRYAQQIIVT